MARREGPHEGLISPETYQRIQDWLNGIGRAPYRKDLNADFPLRGYVTCGCGTPSTACWTKGSHGRYPYYLCPKRCCDSRGKSIRRDAIEGEFEELLRSVEPTDTLSRFARTMFRDAWDRRLANATAQAKRWDQLVAIEKKIRGLLERGLDASRPSATPAK